MVSCLRQIIVKRLLEGRRFCLEMFRQDRVQFGFLGISSLFALPKVVSQEQLPLQVKETSRTNEIVKNTAGSSC